MPDYPTIEKKQYWLALFERAGRLDKLTRQAIENLANSYAGGFSSSEIETERKRLVEHEERSHARPEDH